MVERFFVGDKVRTKRGVGHVVRVVTWRDAVSEMESDYEAEEFCSECKAEVGIGFRKDWVRLMVQIGRVAIPFQAKNVELLEGRYVGPENILGEGLVKKGQEEDGRVGRDSQEGEEEEEAEQGEGGSK